MAVIPVWTDDTLIGVGSVFIYLCQWYPKLIPPGFCLPHCILQSFYTRWVITPCFKFVKHCKNTIKHKLSNRSIQRIYTVGLQANSINETILPPTNANPPTTFTRKSFLPFWARSSFQRLLPWQWLPWRSYWQSGSVNDVDSRTGEFHRMQTWFRAAPGGETSRE